MCHKAQRLRSLLCVTWYMLYVSRQVFSSEDWCVTWYMLYVSQSYRTSTLCFVSHGNVTMCHKATSSRLGVTHTHYHETKHRTKNWCECTTLPCVTKHRIFVLWFVTHGTCCMCHTNSSVLKTLWDTYSMLYVSHQVFSSEDLCATHGTCCMCHTKSSF